MTNSEKCFVFVHKTLQTGSDIQCHIHREWPYGRDEVTGLSNESNEKNEKKRIERKERKVRLDRPVCCIFAGKTFLLCKRPEVERKIKDDR